VNKIEFLMSRQSFEPGIALNFPPAAKLASPQPADLRFDATKNANQRPLVVVDPGDTSRAEASLVSGGNTATAILSSYDWGGFGTFEARATLDDGSVLVGHLITNPSVEKIPIPKRTAPSNIGDPWKLANGVTAKADQVDDEDNPGGNGTNLGDGYSLYEEYRGFFAGGFHTRSVVRLPGSRAMDPQKKDLFVFNQFGPGAVLGFKLLENASSGPGLNVHYELTWDEFPLDRIMNFNHGQGDHRIDQHGVWVRTKESYGGFTVVLPTAAGGRHLPRDVDYVEAYPASPLRAAKTVAHEIGHATSVMHHGDTDRRMVRWTLGSGALTEQKLDTSVTPATPSGPIASIEVRTETGCNGAGCPIPPAAMGLSLDGDFIDIYLGNFEGEQSGDHDCVMRYSVADAYTHEPRHVSTPGVRWWIGAEHTDGQVFDASEIGTGTNLLGRTPRERAGDACKIKERGDCKHLFRVSDALADLPYPLARVCQ
jgi:hypothetical protein